MNGANFEIRVLGFRGFERCVDGNRKSDVGEGGSLGPSSFSVAEVSEATVGVWRAHVDMTGLSASRVAGTGKGN